MTQKKFPSAWNLTAKTKPTQVEARIDMSADVAGLGKCPECKRPMEIVTAAGSRMWACAADRITIPVPNGYDKT